MNLTSEQIYRLKKHPLFFDVDSIANIFQANKHDCFIVGGGVRDILLGGEPKDLDLVSDATPTQIKQMFPSALSIGEAFGIVVLPTQQGPIEVATFRKEDTYSDGRHPDKIEFSNMTEDAKRRDFTVNSLYLNLRTWEIIDLQGGLVDLNAKLLRTVGDAKKRFTEDRLRILRLIRFAMQLDFKIEIATLEAAKQMHGDLKGVSLERIRDEILKAIQHKSPRRLIDLIQSTKMDAVLFGNLKFDIKKVERWSALSVNSQLQPPEHLFLLLWCLDSSKSEMQSWLKKYKVSKESSTRALSIYNFVCVSSAGFKRTGQLLVKFVSEPTLFCYWFLKQEKNRSEIQNEALALYEKFYLNQKPEPLLKGSDLIDLGLHPNEKFGEILSVAFEIQLEQRITSVEKLRQVLGELRLL